LFGTIFFIIMKHYYKKPSIEQRFDERFEKEV